MFTGDLFETEDQRNWTDASFKTYCTPIGLAHPFRAEPGQRFEQSVTIRVDEGGRRGPRECRRPNGRRSTLGADDRPAPASRGTGVGQ